MSKTYRDGPIESDDGGRPYVAQHVVQPHDFSPIGGVPRGSLCVDGGDSRHEGESVRWSRSKCYTYERNSLGYFNVVPLGALLVGQQDELTVGAHSSFSTRVGEQNERQQARDAAMFGKQHSEHPGEFQSSLDQVATNELIARGGGVPGREEKVNDSEYRFDSRGEFLRGRNRVRNVGRRYFLFGSGNSGRHRRLAHEQSSTYLIGR